MLIVFMGSLGDGDCGPMEVILSTLNLGPHLDLFCMVFSSPFVLFFFIAFSTSQSVGAVLKE